MYILLYIATMVKQRSDICVVVLETEIGQKMLLINSEAEVEFKKSSVLLLFFCDILSLGLV